MCDSMEVNCEPSTCKQESTSENANKCPAPVTISCEPTHCAGTSAGISAGVPEECLCPAPPSNSCDFVTPNCCIKLVSKTVFFSFFFGKSLQFYFNSEIRSTATN